MTEVSRPSDWIGCQIMKLIHSGIGLFEPSESRDRQCFLPYFWLGSRSIAMRGEGNIKALNHASLHRSMEKLMARECENDRDPYLLFKVISLISHAIAKMLRNGKLLANIRGEAVSYQR